MLNVIRRMLLILSLMVWQGGFMFYGGVVIPIGARILESDSLQGKITQSVTNYLNLSGAICLTIWLEYFWHERRMSVSRLERIMWCFAAVMLFALTITHIQMDLLLSSESKASVDPHSFGRYHKIYIGTSTLQWLASLVMLFERLKHWTYAACLIAPAR